MSPVPASRLISVHRKVRSLRTRLALECLEDRTLLDAGLAPLPLSALAVDPRSFDTSTLLVRFAPGADAALFSAFDEQGVVIGRELALVPGLREIHLSAGVDLEAALALFRANPSVIFAEPNYHVRLMLAPNDPSYGSQWNLNNIGQTGGTVDADIDAPEAWERTTGSSTIVAVIDTGVDYNHPDLAANMWVNTLEQSGQPGVDDDGNGYVDDVHGYDFVNRDGTPLDDHNHGTHVAGILGAVGNNGIGITGVNWTVRIMALKILDSTGNGTIADAIEALNYAVANGASITNASWGGDPYTQTLYNAIANARDAGHIFVTAAGNGNIFGFGQNNDALPFYPASYNLDNIVAVAATDHRDNLAVFSNYGATSVDLAAPGVSILSTTRNNTYSTFSGTSMATPHVAGVIALVRSLHPDWTYQQVINQVLSTVDPIGSLQGKVATGGRLNAAAAVIPDVLGPRVTSSTPSGSLVGPVSSVRLMFNEPINVSSFTIADIVSFTGPNGAIAVTGVNVVSGSGNRQFDITFGAQSAIGDYSLVLGPDIRDRAGNAMDQDNDGVNGEVPQDRYTANFRVAEARGRFDFGTSTSAVEVGYTQVTHATKYTPTLGYGWLSGSVASLSWATGTALTRDFNHTTLATFVVDVPNGSYDIVITLGDANGAHDLMGIFLEGVQVDTVTTAAGQWVTKTYSVSVSDAQLTLLLDDLGGSDAFVMINGLEVLVGGPDLIGPRVLSTTPSGSALGPVDRIVLTFSEALQDGSFTLGDVVSLTGPGGAITPASVNKLTPNQYAVLFAAQNTAGAISLTVGPNIADAAGNPMDQNSDGVLGQDPQDRFSTSFSLQPGPTPVARFDFGTATSPVAAGYTQVVHTTRYTSALGYGWLSGTVSSVSWSTGTDLTRDFNHTTLATFIVDVPNGTYDVVLTLGDANAAHDLMGIFLEGVHVDTVTTARREWATRTYRVTVSDGQLTLLLDDLGGSDAFVMINGLEIYVPAPGGATSLSLQSLAASPTSTELTGSAPQRLRPARQSFTPAATAAPHELVRVLDRLFAGGQDDDRGSATAALTAQALVGRDALDLLGEMLANEI